jgi:hypothetical protein
MWTGRQVRLAGIGGAQHDLARRDDRRAEALSVAPASRQESEIDR